MARRITIDGLGVGELHARLRAILHRHPHGAVQLSGDELDFVLRCLAGHPSAHDKIGAGVRKIVVDTGAAYSSAAAAANRCFWVERLDGTRVPFSYKRCFAIAEAERYDPATTMRTVIEPQLAAARARYRTALCAHCRSAGTIQVDHVRPFVGIRGQWLYGRGLTLDSIKCERVAPETAETRFVDVALQQDWEAFHELHAEYQPLCADCNSSKSSRLKPLVKVLPYGHGGATDEELEEALKNI